MKLTVRQIAAEAGISPATVSRYMNGTVNVSGDISERIREAVSNLGGEVLRKTPEKYVLVLATHLRYPFYRQAMNEMLGKKTPYQIILIHYDPKMPETVKNYAQFYKPAGVIYFEEEIDDRILSWLQGRGVRTVMLGGMAPNAGSDMVRINDLSAAYEGTNYLLRLGHRKILFLSDEVHKISSGFQRVTGCRQALEEKGLSMDEAHLYSPGVTFQDGYTAVRNALAKRTEFTAIFAFSDDLAIGAMAALHDAGLSVPDDVSVLGFDDLEIAECVRPALTTIHQPIDLFVQKALAVFGDPSLPAHTEILLPFSIRERSSCKSI